MYISHSYRDVINACEGLHNLALCLVPFEQDQWLFRAQPKETEICFLANAMIPF